MQDISNNTVFRLLQCLPYFVYFVYQYGASLFLLVSLGCSKCRMRWPTVCRQEIDGVVTDGRTDVTIIQVFSTDKKFGLLRQSKQMGVVGMIMVSQSIQTFLLFPFTKSSIKPNSPTPLCHRSPNRSVNQNIWQRKTLRKIFRSFQVVHPVRQMWCRSSLSSFDRPPVGGNFYKIYLGIESRMFFIFFGDKASYERGDEELRHGDRILNQKSIFQAVICYFLGPLCVLNNILRAQRDQQSRTRLTAVHSKKHHCRVSS